MCSVNKRGIKSYLVRCSNIDVRFWFDNPLLQVKIGKTFSSYHIWKRNLIFINLDVPKDDDSGWAIVMVAFGVFVHAKRMHFEAFRFILLCWWANIWTYTQMSNVWRWETSCFLQVNVCSWIKLLSDFGKHVALMKKTFRCFIDRSVDTFSCAVILRRIWLQP